MIEWTKELQGALERALHGYLMPLYRNRALACVRLCAGHADLSKCEVVSKRTKSLDFTHDELADLADQLTTDCNKAEAELSTLRAELTHANQVIASQAGEIATLREQLSERTDSMIIHNGQALACSAVVANAYDKLREQLSAEKEREAGRFFRQEVENNATVIQLREQLAAMEAKTIERCWHAINGAIPEGKLNGNGTDRTAERNGLVMAANIIYGLMEVARQDGGANG